MLEHELHTFKIFLFQKLEKTYYRYTGSMRQNYVATVNCGFALSMWNTYVHKKMFFQSNERFSRAHFALALVQSAAYV